MKQRIILGALLLCAVMYLIDTAAFDGALAESAFSNPVDSDSIAAVPSVDAAPASRLSPIETEHLAPTVIRAAALPSNPDERAVLSFLRSRHTAMSERDEENVARAVVREANRHGLDPALVLAVIQVESGGYYLAESHVGAMGLMQLLPSTGEELARKLGLDWRGADSLYDPVLNVQLGTAYIKHLADRYDDVSTALAAYNWGPGRIDRRLRAGTAVPSKYINQVMKAFDVSSSRRDAAPARG
ncbi:MAG: soluble lytic murein transglycosylase-like protein [Myxococcota bacterium]|jgi:soluble lytic murein transglycosylase-like protein